MAAYEGLVLVVGATGGVGRRVVKVLQREGIATRALVHDRTRAAPLEKAGVELVQADVTDPRSANALKAAMQGVQAVVSALGTRKPLSPGSTLREVDYYGTRNLVEAARAAKISHFVLNSTMGVYEHRSLLRPFSILFYPKWQAENYLTQSGLTYTIIRPGGLVDEDADLKGPPGWQHAPALAHARLDGEGGFGGLGRVHRDDVAEAMVKSLWLPTMHNAIFDILDRSQVKPSSRGKILPNTFFAQSPSSNT